MKIQAAAALGVALAVAPAMHYPPTARIAVTDTYGTGTRVVDPYRWLEDDGSARVQLWTRAQNAYTQEFLGSRPQVAGFSRRIAFLARTSASRSRLLIAGAHWFYQRQTPPQPQGQLVVRDGLAGTERVLYDPQTAAGGKPAPAIESTFVSPDGAKVAFTTQEGGAEEETMHVIDTASGAIATDTIAHAGGGTSPAALAWDSDDKGFTYTRWPQGVTAAEAHFNIALYHHTLGSDPSRDTYVFGHGLWKSAEYTLVSSRDGKRVAAFILPGDGLDAAVYVRDEGGPFTEVANEHQGIKDGTFIGSRLLLRTHFRTSRYEVVALDPGQLFAQGRVLIPASKVVLNAIAVVNRKIFTQDIDGGESTMRAFSAAGKRDAAINLPAHIAINDIAGDEKGSDLVVAYTGFTVPSRWIQLEWSAQRYATIATGIETKTASDYSRVRIRRVFVPSLDGAAKIPLTIMSLPATRHDGSAPTVMTAYGSYGIISSPRFLGSWLNWLEHGGVYALAGIRGGGEYGEDWHKAAVHATVAKRADDLAACARWLGLHGYGNARHLGIAGGSAGGYLMGLALTRNPQLYRAVNASVGIYDSLRVELSPNGFFNIPEFGTVTDPHQFTWMLATSPYHQVRRGTAYPAVFMQTGANDPRVSPYQSRKMVAALQYASSSGLPIMLLQKSGQGHGIGSSFGQRVAGQIETQVFFASQLF